ncbi:hypothetical protein GCM10007304_00360 [Rhodococcoides trifolii]|uniref:Glycosyltransferase subfamily 4-like N-terminal domain-containing protein n=1 Tax=Rhodococcoides trifolii TaxID=908250 RepID=A0A917CJH6_9NOCA|nr:glycosyltransferase [Rhodococcus trifolii]GGF90410.1 hypothetical protein GCM10007304_00360 [Rhodococcus trifolii]
MRILVYPHDLALGGSQINAIELAAAVKAEGHEVIVYGNRGPLVGMIADLGVEFVASPIPRRRPSPRVVADLRRTLIDNRIDIAHGYEWPPALEIALATRGTAATPVTTVMSMAVAPFLPRTTDLVVGTRQIADDEGRRGRRLVSVIEPPVDLTTNAASAVDPSEFVHTRGLDPSASTVVTVTRLARELKLEGTLVAMDVIGELARTRRVQLVVVGDGPARAEVDRRARLVNDRVGRTVVIVTGQLDDPRAAYACADVVIGMGGSALRAMAFSKPVVVQGESGFWCALRPDTVEQFLWAGWYGTGTDRADGHRELTRHLVPLLDDAHSRERLGAFSYDTVRTRFSLADAGAEQIRIYEAAIARRHARGRRDADLVNTSARYGRHFVGQYLARLTGTRATEDFNSARSIARGRS